MKICSWKFFLWLISVCKQRWHIPQVLWINLVLGVGLWVQLSGGNILEGECQSRGLDSSPVCDFLSQLALWASSLSCILRPLEAEWERLSKDKQRQPNSLMMEISLRVNLESLYLYSSCLSLPWLRKLVFVNIASAMANYKMAVFYIECIFITWEINVS